MRFILALLPCLFMLATSPVSAVDRPIVAAASSLIGALDEIGRAFARDTGERFRISFGSSGNLTRQIIQGAPFELFLSADKRYAKVLSDKGLADGGSDVYAVGRLVLFIPEGSPLRADPTLEDLSNALNTGRLKRLAMANPEHAPYGRAAREVLENSQLWQQVQGTIIYGENVAQAAQFTVSGDVDAGIIAYSIAREPMISGKGVYVLLPDSLHSPLHHHMVLLNNAGTISRSLYTYLRQSVAQEIFRKFGFSTLTYSQ